MQRQCMHGVTLVPALQASEKSLKRLLLTAAAVCPAQEDSIAAVKPAYVRLPMFHQAYLPFVPFVHV